MDLSADVTEGPWTEYTWILVVGSITAFLFAWSIGANDVANAFGTSVGAKTLKLWHACIIAAVFEFLGALTLGGTVTATIAQDISSPELYHNYPEVYMYGMLVSLASATVWATLATYLELAVSTTHSVIGAIIGFSLVWGKGGGVQWSSATNTFPYVAGVVPIVLSWIISPLLAGILALIIFLVTRTLILRRKRSEALALWSLPVLVFVTILIDLFFILLKGIGSQLGWDAVQCFWVAAATAGGSALLVAVIGLPLLMRRFAQHLQLEMSRMRVTVPPAAGAALDGTGGGVAIYEDCSVHRPDGGTTHVVLRMEPEVQEIGNHLTAAVKTMTATGMWDTAVGGEETSASERLTWRQALQTRVHTLGITAFRMAVHGLVQDVHENLEDDQRMVAMHQAAEIFEPRAELVFKYLQVVSACCVSFAHGSNDVANAVGPLAAIYYVWETMQIPSDGMRAPTWVLAIGATGIVIGLMTYGYNIMRALGVKMAKMTPSRGYSAELSVALTVAVASAFGLPISTTHCIVGAEIGVGLCESLSTGVNWLLAAKTAVSWVATMAITGVLSAALFAQGVYSPSMVQEQELHVYEYSIQRLVQSNMQAINASNARLASPLNISMLLSALKYAAAEACAGGHVNAKECVSALRMADAALKAVSLAAVGYNVSAPSYTNSSVSIPALHLP